MNQNPRRPNNIEELVSQCIAKTSDIKKVDNMEEPPHKKAEREVLELVFG